MNHYQNTHKMICSAHGTAVYACCNETRPSFQPFTPSQSIQGCQQRQHSLPSNCSERERTLYQTGSRYIEMISLPLLPAACNLGLTDPSTWTGSNAGDNTSLGGSATSTDETTARPELQPAASQRSLHDTKPNPSYTQPRSGVRSGSSSQRQHAMQPSDPTRSTRSSRLHSATSSRVKALVNASASTVRFADLAHGTGAESEDDDDGAVHMQTARRTSSIDNDSRGTLLRSSRSQRTLRSSRLPESGSSNGSLLPTGISDGRVMMHRSNSSTDNQTQSCRSDVSRDAERDRIEQLASLLRSRRGLGEAAMLDAAKSVL